MDVANKYVMNVCTNKWANTDFSSAGSNRQQESENHNYMDQTGNQSFVYNCTAHSNPQVGSQRATLKGTNSWTDRN